MARPEFRLVLVVFREPNANHVALCSGKWNYETRPVRPLLRPLATFGALTFLTFIWTSQIFRRRDILSGDMRCPLDKNFGHENHLSNDVSSIGGQHSWTIPFSS